MSGDYQYALEIAGAVVHDFKEFGSYQGDWWAKVTYENKTGWVNGSYGSCSGCDAFQSEFDYSDHVCGDDKYYYPISEQNFREDCTHCQETKKKLIAFGKNYLDNMMSQEEAEKQTAKHSEWDSEAEEMMKFIKDSKI